MPRILRNYLISFLIIGLFALVVYLMNQWAEQRMAEQERPTAPSEEQTDSPSR